MTVMIHISSMRIKYIISPSLNAVDTNSFILTVAIIGVGIYSIEAGVYNVFDSHASDMYYNSHSEGTCVLLEIPSMHN